MACRHFIISGRVQGVYFRAGTRHEASQLGLSGHAINLADGNVEVLACGETAALDILQKWLAKGSDGARVDSVTATDMPDRPLTGFAIG